MANPDINNPASWKKYRQGLCEGCLALCCHMPVEATAGDLVRLELISPDEIEARALKKAAKRLIKEGVVKTFRAGTGKFTLTQKTGGACVFLDKNNRCTVYEKRPETCRNFPVVSSRPGYCPHSLT